MRQKKKLQVFVSSTYEDLKAERQAAVEAILSAGHIPAGMELFAAGDKSQMVAIQRWIDESDIFMLILGGRYGSIEPESGKSYIHLEYEYAKELGKPLFAVVITDEHLEEKVKLRGFAVAEKEHPDRLQAFKREVMSLLVRQWSDCKDIKLAVHETMSDFSRRDELSGWIRGDDSVDAGPLAEELARLTKENAALRRKLLEIEGAPQTYNGLEFTELLGLLGNTKLTFVEPKTKEDREFTDIVRKLAQREGAEAPSLEHAVWMLRNNIVPKIIVDWSSTNLLSALQKLQYYGIVGVFEEPGRTYEYEEPYDEFEITEDGHKFILRLIVERQKVKGVLALPGDIDAES